MAFINERNQTKNLIDPTSTIAQKTMAMNAPNSPSQMKQTTENMTTYIQQMASNYTIVMNSTVKQATTNRNRVLLFFITSLLVISTCVGLSYCILLGCTHYLNENLPIDENVIDFKRTSLVSYDSNANTCSIANSRPSMLANSQRKQSKRSSPDSLRLFLY
ncbi:unnamed protein product [Adineta ricciae]|uniref:Uncharacterized protein n=1 Tax=Adineta ricciae TaxID=249248 RepID=A0A815AAZ3_ADIRI|nr:unnamed protein product [Adineta ricciae]CAF1254197.1 unnamed protein product [Adineta ricciae]